MQTWGCWVIFLAPVPAIDPHCCCGHGALVELLSATVSRVVPADLAHAPIHSVGRRGQLFEASSLPDAELLYVLVELREVSIRTFLQLLSFWIAALDTNIPPQQRVHSLVSSRLLIGVLNRACTQMDPCSTSFVTSLQVQYNLLVQSAKYVLAQLVVYPIQNVMS